MNVTLNKSNLVEYPLNKKSVEELMGIIASKIGERAQKIYESIKAFKQAQGDLKQFDFSVLKYSPHLTESNLCAKILSKKMKAFKCFDCIFQNNSIMCIECFENSEHKGHVYEMIEVHGGCCDCGDEEKWDPKGFCKHHNNSNLVNEMKQKVDLKEEERFIEELTFCFVYWFVLYNDAELCLKKGYLAISQEYASKITEMNKFGVALLRFLNQFNKDSLISNIMTFNLLTSKINLEHFQLSFCPKTAEKPIYEIIFHMTKLASCAEQTVNLYTHLFPLKQFRRILTISFMKFHGQIPEFPMSEFNHLSCQLLTSHKTMTDLVNNKEILPLVYRPRKDKIGSFEELAQNFVRYFIDIEYIASLYKDASLVYMRYHIMSGEFASLGYFKELSYEFQEAVNYYGIEEIRFTRTIKILKIIYAAKDSLDLLEKAIQDLWSAALSHYPKWNKDLFNEETYETASIRSIYICHEMTWAMTVFVYFEKLEQSQPQICEDEKILRLIRVLGLDQGKSSIKQVQEMIEVINNHLVFAGLCMGHPETMDRYYTFFSFTFKKTLSTLSSTLYLYKITLKILDKLYEKFDLSQTMTQQPYFISDQFVFQRPLNTLQKMFNADDFEDDDESIFDRRKNLIRMTSFLHLLIQASETDTHELFLSSFFNLPSTKPKYEKMLNNFYLEVLRNYKKLPLKQFKKIIDETIHNDLAFEKFLTSSNDIFIEHGKISAKPKGQQIESEQNTAKEQTIKVQTQLNHFYFKSLKSKIPSLPEHEATFKVPSSSNHFLHKILNDSFVEKLLRISSAYIDIIIMKDGKIKEKQSANLGLLIIELVKIQKALDHKPSHETSFKITSFFKSLKENKTALSIFTKEVIKIICSEYQEPSKESMKHFNQEDNNKAQERKKKLQNKKQKMKAKFKENQQKFEGAYAIELQKIRKQIAEQAEIQVEESAEFTKQCIVCKESSRKQKFSPDLMLMSFMQLSDVYEHFIKGKNKNAKNCHLVFKSCGHYIHQSCYQKINKIKEYSFCQLCKSPVNCLFTASLSQFKIAEMTSEEIQLLEKNIYENLSLNFSLLFAMDDSLRQDCQNGFAQDLADTRDFKQKLIESLVINILSSAIISKDHNGGFYEKKQFEIYQNILHSLRIFQKGEESGLLMHKKESKKRQQFDAAREQARMNMEMQEEKLFKTKMQIEQNKQKQRVMEITYMMECYLRKKVCSFIESTEEGASAESKYLSEDCIRIMNQAIEKLIGDNSEIKYQIKSPTAEVTNYNECAEVKLLREQVKLYSPPKYLNQVIDMRGKCFNCNLFNNHIFVCVICQWKGCKACKEDSVLKHTALKHAGNSVYIEVDVGNVYFVTKKKYWIYPSVYTDYFGESFKSYVSGIKLDKYTLSEQKWNDHMKRAFLEYDIDTRIRYEENNTKRSFQVPI